MKWIAQGGKDSVLQLQFESVEDFLNFVQSVIVPIGKKYGIDVRLIRTEVPKETKIPIVKP